MERPMGLEPTPGPWQGPVLPLYYGRAEQNDSSMPASERQDVRGGHAFLQLIRGANSGSRIALRSSRTATPEGSADLQYPGGLYDGRLALALGKFGGLFPVGIHASKALPILIEDGDLPVPVLAAAIFSELGAFACGGGFCLGHGLEYLSDGLRSQVPIRSILCAQSNYTL